MYIVAGLGNPGIRYENTKHNVGFDVIELLSKQYNIPVEKRKFQALIGEGMMEEQKVLLMKPQTYMNLSGQSIQEAMHFYHLQKEELLVVFDDISLSPGVVRVRTKGSAGGHNGIKNIIQCLNTQEFARIKVGVGEKPPGWDLADYVLSSFSKEDLPLIASGKELAVKACAAFFTQDTLAVMNEFNRKSR